MEQRARNTLMHLVRRTWYRLVRWIKCSLGDHGLPVGDVQILHYDVHQRIFRYNSFMRCPYCRKPVE